MTVPDTVRHAGPFAGNNVTTTFFFHFKIFEKADVAVIHTSVSAVDAVLALDSDYSVAVNIDQENYPGGYVTYPLSGSPLAGGEKLTIIGNLPYDQVADLPTGGDYRAQVIEDALDRVEMQVQQLAEALGRALVYSPSGGVGSGVVFPPPEANKLIGWNSAGTGLENKLSGGGGGINLGADYPWTGSHTFNAGGTVDPAILVPTSPATRIARTAPTGGLGQVRSPFIIDHKVPLGTQAFEWSLIARNSNYADTSGENVAIYGQAYKYHADGNSFAGVFEAQDLSGNSGAGILCALELDLMANGSLGASSRVGMQMVFGKAQAGLSQAVSRAAIEFSPAASDKSTHKLDNGLDFQLNVDGALIRQSNTASAGYAFDFLNGGGVNHFMRFYSVNMPAWQLVGDGGTLGTYTGRLKIDIDGYTYWLPVYG